MASNEFIYYQLHNGQQNIEEVDLIERRRSDGTMLQIVGNLRNAIHTRDQLHCRPRDVRIYAKGTKIAEPQNRVLDISLPLTDNQVQGTTKDEPLLVLVPPAEAVNTAEIQQQQQQPPQPGGLGDSRIRELEQQNQILSLKNEVHSLQRARIKSTTERLLTSPDDELSRAFDDGIVVDFWLPPLPSDKQWPGEWDTYKTTHPSRKERDVIQPAINTVFQPQFPLSSHFVMVNTSGSWQKMTQDATLFLKNRSKVELTAAAIFKWVGQDESPFPSKKHKAKFVRDCMRLYSRCGHCRQVHGVITDLSRIVAVKLVAVDENMVPTLHKTAIFEGEMVRKLMSQFAFASPKELGVNAVKQWDFGGTFVEGRRAIGSGLHGRVFSIAASETKFVKTFESPQACAREKGVLDALRKCSVTQVPVVEGTSTDGLAFLASPVCILVNRLRGQAAVWLLGAKFVECLQQAHQANFCHRDVRPSNMGYVTSGELIDGNTSVLLFDWASAAETGISTAFTGTVHYAASDVLDKLATGESPDPSPSHDLESLVYAIWDLTRQPAAPPEALSVHGSLNSSNADEYVRGVQNAWRRERDEKPALAELLDDAKKCNYVDLARKMKLRG
mmetsp:Transcript_9736/g.26985  ORF Transcript_9736/g.26985 Transcript_9736/m.26985 type:complete len:614 (-) Transcript_9736:524-2365(-)